jgi:hypothetical protein
MQVLYARKGLAAAAVRRALRDMARWLEVDLVLPG